jgi:aminoglycoside phosphotransferase (APT) family kinase protein
VTEGSPQSAKPWQRDRREVENGLAAWARSFRDAGATVTEVRAPESGMANDTVLFRLDGDLLVARLAPAVGSPYPTFPTFDLEFQQRVIALVRERTTVPVPEVVHLERSLEWLGTPFLIFRGVEGSVPSDIPPYLVDPGGWFLQGTPGDWRRLERSTIEVLVRVHRITDDDDVTDFIRPDAPGATPLARQLASQRRYYDWAREDHVVPVIERAFDVLAATMPAHGGAVLNWGDSRPGNIIYRNFEPAAVLDWEMATIGPPEVDVGWLIFFQRFFAGMAERYELGPVPAMFDRADTATAYRHSSGTALEDLAWYEAFAGLRFGIILARMTLRSHACGIQELPTDPDDLILFAPLLERLLAEI